MNQKPLPYYLANRPVAAGDTHQTPDSGEAILEVTDKYSGEVFARVAKAGPEALEEAIQAAHDATAAMQDFRPYARQEVLSHCAARFRERYDELAEALCREAGKPINDSRGEVDRLIDTFQVAAREAVQWGGEVMNLEISPRARGYSGMWKRFPIGPCSFITPFNFPLNLAAHKVAPAIAAGCPFVLKPAERTPLGALIIGEVLAETELPKGAFSVLPMDVADAGPLTIDPRIRLLSFTGSRKVGYMLKGQAGTKKVVLELGGNAACVVEPDIDLDDAVERIVFGAYYQSGQSCISVQRLLVHQDIYQELVPRLVERVKGLSMGDPREEDTFIGPVISEGDGERLVEWIQEAADGGATVLAGGGREGVMVEPAVVENVPHDCRLHHEEAFGPVLGVSAYEDFTQALEEVNNSRYGLQAGIFTRDIRKIQQAWNTLEVGGLVINDVPSVRVDNMPYGGVKESGLGREGVRFAMEDMTEIRLLMIREME
ncbi:MAG: aldehyde dehydrogenase family protein [Gemmatimonadota bacterium]